jgi:hypothetical protein
MVRRAGPTRLRCAPRLLHVDNASRARAASPCRGECRESARRPQRCGRPRAFQYPTICGEGDPPARCRQSAGSHAGSTRPMVKELRFCRTRAEVEAPNTVTQGHRVRSLQCRCFPRHQERDIFPKGTGEPLTEEIWNNGWRGLRQAGACAWACIRQGAASRRCRSPQ